MAGMIDLLDRFPLSILQLLFRLAIVGVFLRVGLQNFASWESTVALFRDEYKVPVLPPEIAAVMGSTFEVGCSLLLLAGLATRVATLPLLGMLTVIQLFVYPQACTSISSGARSWYSCSSAAPAPSPSTTSSPSARADRPGWTAERELDYRIRSALGGEWGAARSPHSLSKAASVETRT